jgi:periplasmic protein TonB
MPQSPPNTEYAKERTRPMPKAPLPKNPERSVWSLALLALSALGLGWLGGCSTPASVQTRPGPTSSPVPSSTEDPATARPGALPPTGTPAAVTRSAARNARDYRKDAASHLYARHREHIYPGRLPPMLEAVGVLNVDIDRHGGVKSMQWMRAPRHVPHVMQKIEQMVKAAAPYPVPQYMNQVTYTDVWLWHQSGKFQLDTLTEGQD